MSEPAGDEARAEPNDQVRAEPSDHARAAPDRAPAAPDRARAAPGDAVRAGADDRVRAGECDHVLLSVAGLTRRFGGVHALREVDLSVRDGETHAVIGPNGAGKSTLFKLIGGQLVATAGTIGYDGERIDRLAPHRRARRGIAIAFQDAPVFRRMTVAENVMVGAHAVTRSGPLAAVLRLPRHRREEASIRELAVRALDRVGLADQAERPAEALPIGQQRALQVARALCGGPRLLLLDEPASGLRGSERSALADLIEQLRDEGLSILLVEHDVAFVARLADRVTVLDLGRVIASGRFAHIRSDPAVIAAYLGGGPT